MSASDARHAAPGERLEALVRWLAADLGATPGPCPSNAVIAERVGLASYDQATNLLTRAQNAGLIAFETARQHQQRVVRVLPAGLDMVTRRIAPPSPPAPRFADWLATARPGDRYTYFIGHLAETRGVVPDRRTPEQCAALIEAKAVAEAGMRELVRLVSRRRPEGDFEYLAIRCWRDT
ncbi:hypothetical protein [Teichococcus aestuarii]|uniref:hypothetical protein n=1 Tax=Teichococcus aestuarii TaxID=568898 RepID=UPI0036112596